MREGGLCLEEGGAKNKNDGCRFGIGDVMAAMRARDLLFEAIGELLQRVLGGRLLPQQLKGELLHR